MAEYRDHNETEALTKNHRRVCAVIDLDAMIDNLHALNANLPVPVPVCAVIKADAYGSGAVPAAHRFEKEDIVWGYAVATAEEAFELRDADIRKPILVLGYTFPDAYDRMMKEDIRFTVFRNDTLRELSSHARHLQMEGTPVSARVHVAVDCGMSRIGVRPDDSGLRYLEEVLSTEHVELEGIFTHFARADEADLSDAHMRRQEFEEFISQAEELPLMRSLGHKVIHHCANSASIIDMPEAHMDMVRAGVSLYGMSPSDEISKDKVQVRPVLTLISHIAFIKTIEAGTPVSYGGTFVADRPMRIATIPVGYGDGYPRSLSNRGHVLIHGTRARILGRICMDQFMVDVTDIPDAREDDPVILIGRDGEARLTIEELGDVSGRFNYELACDLGRRIPRVYI